ncbi:hypothetical protein COOONC_26776 [Cooperia oncophora]
MSELLWLSVNLLFGTSYFNRKQRFWITWVWPDIAQDFTVKMGSLVNLKTTQYLPGVLLRIQNMRTGLPSSATAHVQDLLIELNMTEFSFI